MNVAINLYLILSYLKRMLSYIIQAREWDISQSGRKKESRLSIRISFHFPSLQSFQTKRTKFAHLY